MAYIGYGRVTADGAIGVSGKPIAAFSVFLDSGSGGAGSVVLRNGSTTSGTAIFTFSGSGANALQMFDLAGGTGVVFPDGCFADIGANTDSVTITYQQVGR